MSKGCDRALDFITNDDVFKVFLYSGENAAVVTDATCYMAWIAEQYGLRLTQEYSNKRSCSYGKGNMNDFNRTICKTSFGTYCNFSAVENKTGKVWDKCQLYTPVEGLAYNVNQCIENTHNGTARYSNCANNCIGWIRMLSSEQALRHSLQQLLRVSALFLVLVVLEQSEQPEGLS